MEFSKKLSEIVKKISKIDCTFCEVFIHKSTHSKDHVVVIDFGSKETGDIKSSGTSKIVIDAFVKALAELGEIIICKENNFKNRNGISGGFISSNLIERAKYELLERDAFLFHYRNKFPFKKKLQDDYNDTVLFEMQSFDKSITCMIATNLSSTLRKSDCILLGFGAHKNKKIAAFKAISELNIMKLDHKIRDNWCGFLENNLSKIVRPPDFHHVKSRDPRNLERFSFLCSNETTVIRELDLNKSLDWEISNLVSPINFLKYVKVNNQHLQQLNFGSPEPIDEFKNNPIFHPVW